MTDTDRLAARLDAVERALTAGDRDLTDLADAAATADRLDDLEDRLEDTETDLAELSAAVRALRGYVGNVDAVNEAVERRADVALAAATAGPDPRAPTVDDAGGDETEGLGDGRGAGRAAGSEGEEGPSVVDGADATPDGAVATPDGASGGHLRDEGWRDACAPGAAPVEGDHPDEDATAPGTRTGSDRPDATDAVPDATSTDPGGKPSGGGLDSRPAPEPAGRADEWLARHDAVERAPDRGEPVDRTSAREDGAGRCPTCGDERPTDDATADRAGKPRTSDRTGARRGSGRHGERHPADEWSTPGGVGERREDDRPGANGGPARERDANRDDGAPSLAARIQSLLDRVQEVV